MTRLWGVWTKMPGLNSPLLPIPERDFSGTTCTKATECRKTPRKATIYI